MIAASEICFGIPLDPVWYSVYVRVVVYDIGRRFDSWQRVSVPKFSKKRRRPYRQEKWYTRSGAIRVANHHARSNEQ